jgi:pimeloyl-ACP methyl ester carboxylesterase
LSWAHLWRRRQPAPGRPWVWHGEFFGHKPAPDIALLGKGFHIVYMRVPDMLGCPRAVEHWNAFYRELTRKYGFAKKVALVGLSRGGLYCYHWAAANPEKVACIYGDAPVCDFKSWPGGKGKGKGSRRDWKLVLDCYGFKSESEALAYDKNPVDNLEPLAKANVPLLHVYGDADDVVPWEENTGLVAERYRKLGGSITLIVKPGVGHHPHGLDDPKPIVEFIAQHAVVVQSGAAEPRRLDPVGEMAAKLEPARRVVYKKAGGRELCLHVFEPEDWEPDDRRPCFLVIHGGGWTGGEPRRMYPFAEHFARLGLVGIGVQYRLLNAKQGTTVLDCVKDGRSAVRFVRTHAELLGVDPQKIIVSGGSAGGHVAVGTALFDGVDEEGEATDASSVPNALVLLFPADRHVQRRLRQRQDRRPPAGTIPGPSGPWEGPTHACVSWHGRHGHPLCRRFRQGARRAPGRPAPADHASQSPDAGRFGLEAQRDGHPRGLLS